MTKTTQKRQGGRRRKDYKKWWDDRISILKGCRETVPNVEEIYEEASKRHPNIDEIIQVPHAWAGIKLALLSYYIGVYSTAIKSMAKPGESKICYIDTFAGPGLVKTPKISTKKVLLYGSPILGMIVPKAEGSGFRMIDKFVFIESDSRKAMILRTVSHLVADKIGIPRESISIITNDMNHVDYTRLMARNNCIHALVFVDPYCCESQWNTIEKILGLPTDVLINFMTAGIRRRWGTEKTQENTRLDEYFGNTEWRKAKNEKDLLNLYVENIRRMNRIVHVVRVNGEGMFYYHIVLATRPTSSGNPWLEPIEKRLKPKIEKTDAKKFKNLISIFEKDISTLDKYF